MLVEMADMTKKAPRGIIENVLVQIDKFILTIDFVIIDMLGDPNEPFILGRPLLKTAHTRIDESSMESINEDNTILEVPTAYTYPSVYGVTNTVEAKGGYDQTPNIFLNLNHYFACSEEESKGKKPKVHNYGPNVTLVDFRKVRKENSNELKIRDSSFDEWLKVKFRDMEVDQTMRRRVFNDWVFKDYHEISNHSDGSDKEYYMDFGKFNLEFGDEIEQLVDENKHRIRKKGDTLLLIPRLDRFFRI
ncbi:phospholipase-like protein [Tanacetum coccineum]